MSLSLKIRLYCHPTQIWRTYNNTALFLKPLRIILHLILTFPLLLLFQTTLVILSLILKKVPSISDSDVKQAILRLSPSKCVGPDDIPSFIINGC
jgi:hypothetical protein